MENPRRELEGKVALVTGSARNIGRETALELARAGARLVVHAQTAKDLCDEVVEEIQAMGGEAVARLADVRDAEAIGDVVNLGIETYGGIDIVVHNAASRGLSLIHI